MCRRVEGFEIFNRHFRQASDQGHIHVPRQGHGLEVGVIRNGRELNALALWIGDQVLHRLQFGHIQAGLCWHTQVGVGNALTRFEVSVDGFAHIAFTPVVGGQSQVPVAKHAMQALQIVQCCAGRGEHVAAIVAESVLFQVKVFAGARHELPHATGAGRRHRLRIERTFNKRQQSQFGRHSTAFNFFNDVVEVFA